MSANTKIEWTDHSWSPWWGCVEVSPACDHCYARELAKRYGHKVWGSTAERREMSAAHWKKPLRWNAEAASLGIRYRVFPSMCDPFEHRANDGGHLDGLRSSFFGLIDDTKNLNWLLLTKRPQNIPRLIPERWSTRIPAWVGATVEDRARLWRIDELRKVKARVRFLSIEPLLEDLGTLNLTCIDWVIVGGESGHGARPMHPDWARSIRDQCVQANVPFFFKQWGEWLPQYQRRNVEAEIPSKSQQYAWDAANYTHRIGTKCAGRLLDGREWSQFPEVKR